MLYEGILALSLATGQPAAVYTKRWDKDFDCYTHLWRDEQKLQSKLAHLGVKVRFREACLTPDQYFYLWTIMKTHKFPVRV